MLAMTVTDPPRRATRALAWAVLAPAGLILLTSVVVLTDRADPRRPKAPVHLTASVALAVAPTVSVGFSAGPGVTSPAAVVARFSIWLLPLVAFVVAVSRMRELTVARIGGLYGP